jgi:glutathione S-transferase
LPEQRRSRPPNCLFRDHREALQLLSQFRQLSRAHRAGVERLDYDYAAVHLVKEGGQQFAADFKALNPAALVPVLDDDGTVLTQSLAIIEYLDETRPQPPLLPADAAGRARVRALALAIACEIHPLNNLRVLGYLTKTLGVSRGAEERLVPALGRNRARHGRGHAGRRSAHGGVLPWRCTDHGRYAAGAADFQCAALQLPP